ncbi:hypothetical protein Tco_1354436 [Tanacetum coccineum]
MSTEKVQNPNLENTAHVPPPEEEDSIFIEIPKPKAKKTVNVEIQDLNSPRPIPSKLPYPERMKDWLKDALSKMPKFKKMVKIVAKDKEKLEAFAIYVSECEMFAIFDEQRRVISIQKGDVKFRDLYLSDGWLPRNLASEDDLRSMKPEQNESSILLSSPWCCLTVLGEISTSQSNELFMLNPNSSVIESLPVSPIPVEDSEPTQEEIDIFLVLDDLIPPGVENDDSEDEVNELPNLDHQDDPSIPRPPRNTDV